MRCTILLQILATVCLVSTGLLLAPLVSQDVARMKSGLAPTVSVSLVSLGSTASLVGNVLLLLPLARIEQLVSACRITTTLW